MGSGTRTYRRLGTLVAGIVSLLLGAVLVVFLASTWVASAKQDAVRARWTREVGTLEELLAAHPPRDPNATALEVERLAARIGIDITPRWVESGPRPDDRAIEAYQRVRKDLGDHITRHVERNKHKLTLPREETLAWFDEHRESFASLRRLLVDEPVPYWHRDLERMLAAPIPNLLGHINLQNALLGEVLVNEERGERDAVIEGLEASWRLNLALRDDPLLIEQLIAVSVARLQAGTLRQLDEPPAIWRERLDSRPYREAFVGTVQVEGWIHAHTDFSQAEIYDSHASWLQERVTKLVEPYVAYSAALANESYLRKVQQLVADEPSCDGLQPHSDRIFELDIPEWAAPGLMLAPGYFGFDRLRRLELDLEMTAVILDHRRRREPAELPSTVCPDDRWIVEPEPDGGLTVAFSREFDWPDQQAGARLPPRFRLPPRRSAVTRLD